MQWLIDRLKETSTYGGIVSFIVGIVIQLVPAAATFLTPEVVNAITVVLVALGGALFAHKPEATPAKP